MPVSMLIMHLTARTMAAFRQGHNPKLSGLVSHIMHCGVYGSPGGWLWCCGWARAVADCIATQRPPALPSSCGLQDADY